MKKILLTLMVAVSSLAASAQVYVGGEVGFWRNYDENKTTFSINPHIGYTLNDNWALGLGLGYNHDYKGGTTISTEVPVVGTVGVKTKGYAINSLKIEPYARYTFAKFGSVSLFLDGGFGIENAKASYDDAHAQSAWYVGIRPGVKVSLSEKLDFVAHCGFLGYRDNDTDYSSATEEDLAKHEIRGYSSFGKKGFGFDVDGCNLTFGLYYNF